MNIDTSFPGGSKKRVNRAGENVRKDLATQGDLEAIETWRAAHRSVLNTFQAILRNRTRETDIVVAQRHKRKATIFGKLKRFPKMQLSRMDDIAGCRLIFPNLQELYEFREKFHRANFRHRRRNETDKYDYIKSPKQTGYRGIHDVYVYDVNSESGRSLKGLFVELQYRTSVQHAWATTVEVIGFITESQPKFEEGDLRYKSAMALAREILARSFEDSAGPLKELSDKCLIENFLKLDEELNLLNTLKGLNATDKTIGFKKNAILISPGSEQLEIKTFRDATEALRALFKLEQEFPEYDMVLVKADSNEEVRVAFKNYFSDSYDFIELVEQGCHKLSGKKIIRAQI